MRSGKANEMKLIVLTLLVVCLYGVNGECMRNNVRCLEYNVLQSYDGYEVREYPPVVWVSASAQARRKMDVSRSLIKQLYAYLGGANDRDEKFDMMVPVRTTKIPDGDVNNYTIAIALRPEQSENPPVPLNPNVTVTREPKTVIVSRSFSGQARQDTIWDNHARILKSAVANDDSVDTSFYYMSVYDSPWRETDRLNEVWMAKTE